MLLLFFPLEEARKERTIFLTNNSHLFYSVHTETLLSALTRLTRLSHKYAQSLIPPTTLNLFLFTRWLEKPKSHPEVVICHVRTTITPVSHNIFMRHSIYQNEKKKSLNAQTRPTWTNYSTSPLTLGQVFSNQQIKKVFHFSVLTLFPVLVECIFLLLSYFMTQEDKVLSSSWWEINSCIFQKELKRECKQSWVEIGSSGEAVCRAKAVWEFTSNSDRDALFN